MHDYHTDKLREYLNSFEQKCQDGLFEELSDNCLYKHVGDDSNGLDLWIRLRGSNQAENMHQQMKSSIGAWNVGAEIGHHILVLLSCRYNISASISRCGNIDFGMPCMCIIDRLQMWVQQIHNVIVWKNYRNLTLSLSNNSFVSVGIGELHYPEIFVSKGTPDSRIVVRDINFMALKMKLAMPPMPISHLHEIKIFNDFIKQNPSFTSTSMSTLTMIFKDKSNGTTIIPKLPSLIKHYCKRWEANSLIQLAKNTMKTNLNELLQKFKKKCAK